MAYLSLYNSTQDSISVYIAGLDSGYEADGRMIAWFISKTPDNDGYGFTNTEWLKGNISDTSSSPYTFTDLDPGTTYWVTCVIMYIVGHDDIMLVQSFSTKTGDFSIGDFSAYQLEKGSLEIHCEWDNLSGYSSTATWSVQIDGYTIYGNQPITSSSGGVNFYVDNFKEYTIKFTVNSDGVSRSVTRRVTLEQDITNIKPDPPYLYKRVDTGLYFTWNGDLSTGDNLILEYRTRGTTEWKAGGLYESIPNDGLYVMLDNATTYEFRSHIRNKDGMSQYSDIVISTTSPSSAILSNLYYGSVSNNGDTIALYKTSNLTNYNFTRAAIELKEVEFGVFSDFKVLTREEIMSSTSDTIKVYDGLPPGKYRAQMWVYYYINDVYLPIVDDNGDEVVRGMDKSIIGAPILVHRASNNTSNKAQLRLRWERVPSELTTLKINYKKASDSSFTLYDVPINPHTSDSILLDGLDFATTYDLKFFAYKEGSSRIQTQSNVSKCTTPPDNRLLDDSSFSITLSESNQIQVRQLAEASNYTFTAAMVSVSSDRVTFGDTLNYGNVNPIYFNNLASGTYTVDIKVYYLINGVQLYPVNANGDSLYITKKITVDSEIYTPTNLRVTLNKYQGCKFAWDPITNIDGATTSVGYNVEVFYGDNCVWTLSTTATEVDITGLQCSKSYTIRVQAWQMQTDGNVIYSEWVVMEKPYVTYPPKPKIDKISQTDGNITAEWSWEDGDIKDVSQVYYTLYRSDGTALLRGSTVPEKKYGSCTFAEIDPGDYYVAVTTMFEYNGRQLWCVDENGNQYKATADIVVVGEGLKTPQPSLGYYQYNNTNCDLLLLINLLVGAITEVEIEVYKVSNNELVLAEIIPRNYQHWILGLEYNTAYKIRARSRDATGATSDWGVLEFTTPTKVIMGASFAAVNGGIKITWDMVENATKYRINLTDTTTGIKTSQEAITSPYTWLGLKYGVKYKCTIDVYNGVWQEGTSTFEFVTPPARPVIESAIWSKKEKKIKVVWSLEHTSEIGEVGVYIYPKGSNSSVAGKTVNDGSTWGTTEFSSVTAVGVYTVVVTSNVPNIISGLTPVYSLADDGGRYKATRDVVIEKADLEYWSWHRGTDTDVIADSDRGRAYDAFTTKGLLSEFTYQTWNELVDKVQEVIDYINDNDAEGCWQTKWFTDGGHLSKNDTYMYYNDKVMTAARFNALRYNIGTRYSTGIADKSPGDPIFGDYFVMLTDALNWWIYDVAVWKAGQDAIRENQN